MSVLYVICDQDGEPRAFVHASRADAYRALFDEVAAGYTVSALPFVAGPPVEPRFLWEGYWHAGWLESSFSPRPVALRTSATQILVWPWTKLRPGAEVGACQVYGAQTFASLAETEEDAIRLVNEARAQHGLPLPVVADPPYRPLTREQLDARHREEPGVPLCVRCGQNQAGWETSCPDPEMLCRSGAFGGPLVEAVHLITVPGGTGDAA